MAENVQKPTAAFVLSLIGGIIILLIGAAIASVGTIISLPVSIGSGVLLIGIAGVVNGLIIVIGSVLMYQNPQTHVVWGVVILVLSLVSWITTLGGFFIGFILTLIGAILALVFHP